MIIVSNNSIKDSVVFSNKFIVLDPIVWFRISCLLFNSLFLLIYWSKYELDLLWLRQKKYSFDERYIAHRAICKYENVGVYASFVIAWIFGTTVCFNWIWFVVSPPSLFLSLSLKNHPIFNVTLFRRHYWTPVSATAAELNGIMQNSQFWGKTTRLRTMDQNLGYLCSKLFFSKYAQFSMGLSLQSILLNASLCLYLM